MFLRYIHRLAASVLSCGNKKVWLDPNEQTEISNANSRQAVRKLIKNGLVIKRANAIHSKARHQRHMDAKRKGRHTGEFSCFLFVYYVS